MAAPSAAGRQSGDDASLVVVILEANPKFWCGTNAAAASSCSQSFDEVLTEVLVFVNSILLLHQLNEVLLIATGSSSWEIVFDSSSGVVQVPALGSIPASPIRKRLEHFLEAELAAWKEQREAGEEQGFLLSGALSMALCYIHRKCKGGAAQAQPRILCLQGSPDAPQQYVAVMNAIFSAQRHLVPVDACILGSHHSAFLQQAAHISGGVYVKPQQGEGLMEYLMMLFATDLCSRRFLQLPSTAGVDFRASCFCHKRTLDMGFVCSVCLSIFCKHQKCCSTCGADFTLGKAAAASSNLVDK